MKTLWNIISVIAVANLIALGGALAWLKMNDRLDTDRARKVREMFSTTIAADRSKAELAVEAEALAKTKAEAEAKAAKPPLTASEKLQSRIELSELDEQRMQRVRREVEDLRAALAKERTDLDQRWTQLEADRQAFDRLVNDSTAGIGEEQFKKTLDILQGLKAPAAKQLLMQMMGEQVANVQPPADGLARPALTDAEVARQAAAARVARETRMRGVIEYINAMDDRARTRIMTEFTKDDPALAASLLEALRRHGQFARADAAP